MLLLASILADAMVRHTEFLVAFQAGGGCGDGHSPGGRATRDSGCDLRGGNYRERGRRFVESYARGAGQIISQDDDRRSNFSGARDCLDEGCEADGEFEGGAVPAGASAEGGSLLRGSGRRSERALVSSLLAHGESKKRARCSAPLYKINVDSTGVRRIPCALRAPRAASPLEWTRLLRRWESSPSCVYRKGP